MMLSIPFALLSAFLALSAPRQVLVPPTGNYTAWIVPLSGETSRCDSWVDARRNEGTDVRATGVALSSRAWMWGFVSGASTYGLKPLDRVSAAEIDGWVDKYCLDHPLASLDQAGRVLVAELAARAK